MGEACVDEMMKELSENGEKILVSVRVRPLNSKEIARRDVSDWECVNDDTILFRNNFSVPDRSVYPSAYTFDRVFGCDSSTRQVYEKGAKEVALSVVNGINSSIFAYGQTSSGKTYTMGGITEYAMADIYEYIEAHKEREFFLRFSAMEIYNESVRDLLSSDTTPLRLLDDPERGTIVEKLTEETLMDWNHLKELLSVCEAQRQVGETSLNETSSRSHQILRLTIESSAREFLRNDCPSTLTSTVNFVDLAGSERASQSLSAGSRLKEGCHINRSLLTLGTVIRKLSKGRNGHVPFRDSKLTRILQSSLDGNARTAIICTMSPARTHVEQSRNTLLFASCAKEVTTNAQVNVVVSDKALVKHLQRELGRLEIELRMSRTNSVTSESTALLREKDIQIEELKKEIAKLISERDLAQSHVDDFRQLSVDGDGSSSILEGSDSHYPKLRVCKSWDEEIATFDISTLSDSHSFNDGSFEASMKSNRHSRSNSEDHYMQFPEYEATSIKDNSSPHPSSSYGGTNPCNGWDEVDKSIDEILEDLCKEVRCIEMEESSTNRHAGSKIIFDKGNPEHSSTQMVDNAARDEELVSFPLKEERELSLSHIHHVVGFPSPENPSLSVPTKDTSTPRYLSLSKSRSCKASFASSLSSPWFETTGKNEKTPPDVFERNFCGRPEGLKIKVTTLNYDNENELLSRKDSSNSVVSTIMEELKEQNFKTSRDEDTMSIDTIKEMKKLQYENQLADTQAHEAEPEAKEFITIAKDVKYESPPNWPSKFKKLQKEIIDLWDVCNTSLLHRTYFFLLFEGDPADSIYIEVELRRLSFLKNTFSQGKETVEDGQILTPASSMKALRQEREMLSKQMLKKLSEQDRESLYLKWGIELKTKNRRLQLAYHLWTDTKDMNHITESANIVANLAGFIKPEQANKEMFGLNFTPRYTRRTSFSWKHSLMSVL